MKRGLVSVAGGLGTMLSIIAGMIVSNRQSWLESVFFWMVAFPVFIFGPLFPAHPKPDDAFPGFSSPEAAWATLIFDLVFYSLLAYLILRWRGRSTGRRSSSRRQLPAM
jgi:hypothetical protein